MGINPDDFEKHADRVETDYNDEISRRNVICRKYYHIFHVIRENGDGDSDSNFSYDGGDHKEARDFLKRKGQQKLARKVNRLHEMRKDADYELSKSIDQVDLQYFNRRHQQFLNQLQYLSFI